MLTLAPVMQPQDPIRIVHRLWRNIIVETLVLKEKNNANPLRPSVKITALSQRRSLARTQLSKPADVNYVTYHLVSEYVSVDSTLIMAFPYDYCNDAVCSSGDLSVPRLPASIILSRTSPCWSKQNEDHAYIHRPGD